MELLITILVTFFAGMGRRTGHRIRGHERRRGDQSHAHHISGYGPLYGRGHRTIFRCAGQRRFRLYLW